MGTLRKLRRSPTVRQAMLEARVKYLCPEHAPPAGSIEVFSKFFNRECDVCRKRSAECVGVKARELAKFIAAVKAPKPEPKKPTEAQIKQARDFLRAQRPDMTREQVEAEAVEAATAYFCRGERI